VTSSVPEKIKKTKIVPNNFSGQEVWAGMEVVLNKMIQYSKQK
jgi:hypothetical protein